MLFRHPGARGETTNGAWAWIEAQRDSGQRFAGMTKEVRAMVRENDISSFSSSLQVYRRDLLGLIYFFDV